MIAHDMCTKSNIGIGFITFLSDAQLDSQKQCCKNYKTIM